MYLLQWSKGSAVNDPPDVTGLPSVEDARYLFSTVKFHIGQIYRLLDEATFVTNMDSFYAQGASSEKANELRSWYVQFLLVLSLGKAFLSQSKNRSEPPGSKFFKRAMAHAGPHLGVERQLDGDHIPRSSRAVPVLHGPPRIRKRICRANFYINHFFQSDHKPDDSQFTDMPSDTYCTIGGVSCAITRT